MTTSKLANVTDDDKREYAKLNKAELLEQALVLLDHNMELERTQLNRTLHEGVVDAQIMRMLAKVNAEAGLPVPVGSNLDAIERMIWALDQHIKNCHLVIVKSATDSI